MPEFSYSCLNILKIINLNNILFNLVLEIILHKLITMHTKNYNELPHQIFAIIYVNLRSYVYVSTVS